MLLIIRSRLLWRIGVVFILAGGVFLFGYGDNVVLADNVYEIDSCNSSFDTHMGSCDDAYWTCDTICFLLDQGPECNLACQFDRADCYGNVITGSPLHDRTGHNSLAYEGDGLSGCLNDVVFQMEMCPNAEEAASLCDAAFTGCEAAALGIEDEQDANSLVAGCMYTQYQCLQKSGLWQCQ